MPEQGKVGTAATRVHEVLEQARALGVPRLDAQLLLGHLLARPRAWLLAHDDFELDPALAASVQALLERRAAGEPLAYVTGHAPFRGLDLAVSPAVLIPRPETELLVEWALECLPGAPSREVLELGTGSGAIALALAREAAARCGRLQLHASDASAAALAVAQRNATALGLPVRWREGSWFAPWQGRQFGLVLANPPYVAAGDPHLAALVHEPLAALVPAHDLHRDGLAALRHIVAASPAHLQPGAWLLLEHGHDQAEAVRAMLADAGLVQAQTRADLAGLPRCSGAMRPA